MKPEVLEQLADKMGEAVHNEWLEKWKAEKGWHNPRECPDKLALAEKSGLEVAGYSDCGKCHSCMKPYSELPDSEKELDRRYPVLFFKILSEMGYKISKKVKMRKKKKTEVKSEPTPPAPEPATQEPKPEAPAESQPEQPESGT